MKNKSQVAVPEVVTAFDQKEIAAGLVNQYNLATQAIKTTVKEVLKFGAMLVKVEQAVFAEGKLHRGVGHAGEGLESWLAANCPGINYKTAMRWKKIAENAIAGLGCDTENGVLLLTGNAEEMSPEMPIGEMMDRVDELYEAKSVRQLSQMVFDFAADDRAERREAAAAKPLPKLKKSEEAKAIWNQVMQHIAKSSVKDSIPLLDETTTKICYDDLRDVVNLLKGHLDEFRR